MNQQIKVIKTITQDKAVGGVIKFALEGGIDERLFEKIIQKKIAQVIAKQIFEDSKFKEHILDRITYEQVPL